MYYVALVPTDGGRAYSILTSSIDKREPIVDSRFLDPNRVSEPLDPIRGIGKALDVFDTIVRGSNHAGIVVLYRYLPESIVIRTKRKANGRKRRCRGTYKTATLCETIHIAWAVGK